MSATFLEVARLIRFGSRRRPWRVSDLSVAGVIVCDGLNVREHMFVAVARDESEAPVRREARAGVEPHRRSAGIDLWRGH
jgi:hypothetical protein